MILLCFWPAKDFDHIQHDGICCGGTIVASRIARHSRPRSHDSDRPDRIKSSPVDVNRLSGHFVLLPLKHAIRSPVTSECAAHAPISGPASSSRMQGNALFQP